MKTIKFTRGSKQFLEIINNLKDQDEKIKLMNIDINTMKLFLNSELVSQYGTVIMSSGDEDYFTVTEEEFRKSIYGTSDFKDFTGYEAFYNSFYISDFFAEDVLYGELSREVQLKLGQILIENISQKEHFPKCAVFLFDFSEFEGKFELKIRFYTYRENEPWASEDNLEESEECVGYYIVEGKDPLIRSLK